MYKIICTILNPLDTIVMLIKVNEFIYEIISIMTKF